VVPRYRVIVQILYSPKARHIKGLYSFCTAVYRFCTVIFACTENVQLKERGDFMRLNLRNVPDELVEQIDQRLAQLNAQKGTTMTRNKYLLTVLTEYFTVDNTSQLRRMNSQIEDLLTVLHEHVAAEQLLIYTLINNGLPDQKEDNHAE
jgi:uncharacterized protein (DUF885 family)